MAVDTETRDSFWAGDVWVTGKPSLAWCVYVLECEWRHADQRHYEPWQFAASKANKRIYVGSTNDLGRRVGEHKERTGQYKARSLTDGSIFTQEFPPKKILELHFFKTEPDARWFEEVHATELDNSNPGWFVWQN